MNLSAEYIHQICTCFEKPPLMYQVLGERGIEFNQIATARPGYGEPKQCFQNAYHLARLAGLHYVEGFAASPVLPIPVEHAWCVDDMGHVYDPTWIDGSDYFGMRVKLDVLEQVMQHTGCYGLFGNLHGLKKSVEETRQFLLDAAL